MTWLADRGGTEAERVETPLLEAAWYFSGMGGGGGMAVAGVGGIRLIPWVVGLVEKPLIEEEDGGAMVTAAIPFNAILMMGGKRRGSC